ncbi:MAG TPA: ATP synthase F1 subunit gamma [Armatimonadota bacterium]|nr:ATP synthase F1 subunit gamma [Armatimonadota bacterium]
MLSTRDIQRKIRTVRNIQQICRAMKTVASIKLRKAEERILAARPYADALREMVAGLADADYAHPLLAVRAVRRTLIVAVSADKGLAGAYNTNLIRETLAQVRAQPGEVALIPVGRKVADVVRRLDLATEAVINPLGGEPRFRTFAALADQIAQRYTEEQIDRVLLVYSRFGGGITTQDLLPLAALDGDGAAGDVMYEPSPAGILEQLLPRYLRTSLYTAVLSAAAAEHAARVAAMSLATDNAEDVIARLTMDYNKSRQASITNELVDIVGAAEALV